MSVESGLGAVELGEILLGRLSSAADPVEHALDLGEVLISEGDEADAVYVLMDGWLEVSKTIEGRAATIAELTTPGTVIGEMVTLGGGHRSATVKAVAPSRVVRLSAAEFHKLMAEDRVFASTVAQIAVRRAEEGELAEILVRKFGVENQALVASACASVMWKSLATGDCLFTAGDDPTSVFFVVRGRLKAERVSDDPGMATVAAFAKGDIVGEIDVLADRARSEDVTAVRHSVVAEMQATHFMALAESQPRLLFDMAISEVSRLSSRSSQESPATIIALALGRTDRGHFKESLAKQLSRFGKVNTLSAELVEQLLDTPGVSNSESGDVGDVRVSRLVHEYELDSDHLIIEIGDQAGAWATRVLGLADRILAVSPASPNADHVEMMARVLADAPEEVRRTLIVEHPDQTTPTATSKLLSLLGFHDAIHIAANATGDLERAARVVAGHGHALVIGGGGARGFAHIGAYRAMRELDIPVDIVAGTSIGGVLGTAIADDDDPDAILDMAERQFQDVMDYTIPVVSLIKGERIARAARSHFGDREVEDLWKTYRAVSTDLTSSRPHVHDSGDIVTAIRATSALPGVMPPVPLGEALLVDGGVLNNLPLDVARSIAPAGTVVAFDVAPPRGPGAHGDYGLAVSGWQALRARSRRQRSPYPRLSAVLMRSMITASMHERDRQVSGELADFYLNLDMRGVSMMDFSSPSAVAARGYEAAMPVLEHWLNGSRGTDL